MAVKQKYACGFCKKAFTNERTLSAHMCPKKRRNLEKDTVASRMGLTLFQRFMRLASPTTTRDKTFEDFIDSQYYTAFIKFARHLMDLRPLEQDRFIDYVFHSGIPLKKWCRDEVYEAFIVDYVLKETAVGALERSIKEMEKWGERTGHSFNEFFLYVTPSEFTHMVRMGKISPWVIFFSDTCPDLVDFLSPQEGQLIQPIIDMNRWRARFARKPADCNFVREVLAEAGI